MTTRTVSETINLGIPAEKVSKYITAIDQDGIKVHAGNNSYLNYVKINAEGMEITQNDVSKAKFGESVRVGNGDDSVIYLNNDSIIGQGQLGKPFFEFNGSSGSSGTDSIAKQIRAIENLDMRNTGGDAGYYYFSDSLKRELNSVTTFKVIVSTTTTRDSTTVSKIHNFTFTRGTSSLNNTITISETSISFYLSYYSGTSERIRIRLNSAPSTGASGTINFMTINYSVQAPAPVFSLGSNTVTGSYSFAMGKSNTASGNRSHAEGNSSTASGSHSFAKGVHAIASGNYSFAHGNYATASGELSTAIGYYVEASARDAVAIGSNVSANNTGAVSIGSNTIASKANQMVIGKYNIEDTETSTDKIKAFIIGNGESSDARSNAFTVDRSGVVNCKDVVASNLIGEIKQYAGVTVPTGWLECDGSEVAVADYPLLYAAIGDLWGTPSDSDHFVLPDFRGKVAVGHDNSETNPDSDFDTVGKSGGNKNIQAHTHAFTQPKIPSHSHSMGNIWSSGSGSSSAYVMSSSRKLTTRSTSTDGGGGACTGGAVGSVSGVSTGNSGNLQPYAIVKYIICAA